MDPYCFVKWHAERAGAVRCDPKPCTYMLFQHPDDFSEPRLTEGRLEERDVLSFVQTPCRSGFHSEVRFIFTPQREPNPPATFPEYTIFQPWPFSFKTLDALKVSNLFNEIPILSSYVDRVRTSMKNTIGSGLVSLSIVLNRFRGSFMQVLVSRNEQLRTTTIIVHNTLPSEFEFIHAAVMNSLLKRISLHPVFIFALVINSMCREMLPVLLEIGNEVLKPLNLVLRMEANNVDIEAESHLALRRQHGTVQCTADIEQTLHAISKMKSWCEKFDNCGNSPKVRELYKSAGLILLDYLADLEDTFIHANIENKRAQAFTQAYKQSLDIHNATINNKLNLQISSQSRDIARESKRDSSAMKAIALLTMFFLPGTFVAAFFAMPLFDWEAPTSNTVLKSRFWIYWAVTVPATAIVLVLWRMWFKFDHWRMMRSEPESIWKDAGKWLKSGRPKPEAEDVEKGV